jgi:hypothetical protein
VREFGEGVRGAGDGTAEGVLLGVGVPVLILVSPRLGFGVVEAAEGPFAADEVVDVEALFGVGGVVVEVALVDELRSSARFSQGRRRDLAWMRI